MRRHLLIRVRRLVGGEFQISLRWQSSTTWSDGTTRASHYLRSFRPLVRTCRFDQRRRINETGRVY